MVSVLAYLLKKFYILCAVVIIGLAVLIQGGRSLFPLLEHYDTELTGWLSRQLDLDIQVASLEADWQDLRPEIVLHDLVVNDGEGRRLLDANRVLLRLNLLSSALEGRVAWDKVELRRPRLSLSQGADGFWGLPVLSSSDNEPLAPDDLLTLFELGTRVELLEARIDLSFASGHEQRFVAPYLLLEHRDNFHRMSLQIDFEAQDRALVAVIEGQGDPREPEQFRTRGYLQLRDFPTLEPLSVLGGILLGEGAQQEWYREGHMDASLWFSSQEEGLGYDWSGTVSLDDVALPVESLTLDRVSTDLSGQWQRDGAWELALGNLSADWRDRELEPLQVSISSEGREAPVAVQVDHLKLDYWTELAEQLGLLNPPRLREVITTLAPSGSLRHLNLELPHGEWQDWTLQAEMEAVAVEPWQGVPGLSGVTGYLEAGRDGGFIDLDSRNGFSMYFAKTYAGPMEYQTARGQVAWHLLPEQNRIYVNSGPLTLRGQGEQARGSMWLSLPWERNTGDIDLYLDVYGEQLSANVYQKYLPEVVPDSLRRWLEQSIGRDNAGRAAQAHFVFRGTINRPDHPLSRSYQLALDMTGADLAYHPDWPVLSDLTGQLVLNDNRVDARVDHARLYQSEVDAARIVVKDNPQGEGLLLTVDGQVQALASDGLQLLRGDYLRRFVGDNMDSWSVQGSLVADLDLAIPLDDGQPGAYQRVDMELMLPRLTMGDLGLTVRDVTGPLRYVSGSGSNDGGLSSEGIEGHLFGAPLTLAISGGEQDGTPTTELAFSGTVSGARLAQWSQHPELRLIEGQFDFDSTLILNHHPAPDPEQDQRLASLTVTTDLTGVTVNLPAPIGKTADEARPAVFNLILGRRSSLADLRYGDEVHAVAQLNEEKQLRRAALGFDAAATLPDAPGIRLDGQLASLDLQGWKAAFERYQALASPLGPVDGLGDGLSPQNDATTLARAPEATPSAVLQRLPLQANLTLASHRLGPLHLEDLHLNLTSRRQGWRLSFESAQAMGDVVWGEDAVPELHLARLALSESALSDYAADTEASAEEAQKPFDPTTVPAANVAVDQLTIDGEDYGFWSFHWRPGSDSIRLENLVGDIRGIHIEGEEEGQGAQLVWHSPGGAAERTRLQALLRAGDLADVMSQWGQSDIIESEAATYGLDLEWAGPPQSVQLEKLEGDVGFDVRAGRFKRNPAAGSEGILRLFSILNFDALARRLRLDFSDLYQSGLAFDSIEGRMTFERGSVVFSEPVLVRSPSSRLQLGGRVDLLNETLDARLVATLPVAGNLTFLTALAAGLPAAAGVFLVSKLFEKQMDQATSISYTIRGDWDDPVIKFDRLFEGGANLDVSDDPAHPEPEEASESP